MAAVTSGCDYPGPNLKAIRQPVRKRSRLLQVVRLNIGRRDLYAEVAVAILTRAEIAAKRKQRPHLASFVAKMDAAGEDAAVPGCEFSHRI